MKWQYGDTDRANIRGNLNYNIKDPRLFFSSICQQENVKPSVIHSEINKMVNDIIEELIINHEINEDNYTDIDIDDLLNEFVCKNCEEIGLDISSFEVTHYIFFDKIDLEIQ